MLYQVKRYIINHKLDELTEQLKLNNSKLEGTKKMIGFEEEHIQTLNDSLVELNEEKLALLKNEFVKKYIQLQKEEFDLFHSYELEKTKKQPNQELIDILSKKLFENSSLQVDFKKMAEIRQFQKVQKAISLKETVKKELEYSISIHKNRYNKMLKQKNELNQEIASLTIKLEKDSKEI